MPEPSEPAIADCTPVFICGRQHSGNTMLTSLVGLIPDYYVNIQEGDFFSYRDQIDAIEDPADRADLLIRATKFLDPAMAEQTRTLAEQLIRQHPQTSAIDLYRQVMQHACELNHARHWAQKATHYIFFADEILRDMPEAKMIYLLRNPFDLAASVKRRMADAAGDLDAGMSGCAISWNRGLRLARRFEAAMPQRFKIVRYEDVVYSPDDTVASICAFLDQPFSPELLDVPVINRAEAKYQQVPDMRGFDTSRLYRFRKQLDAGEIATMSLAIDNGALQAFYPQLFDETRIRGVAPRLRAAGRLLGGAGRLAWRKARSARKRNLSVWQYFRRRLAR